MNMIVVQKKTNTIVIETIIRKSENINQSHFNEEPIFTVSPSGNGAKSYENPVNKLFELEGRYTKDSKRILKQKGIKGDLVNG